MPSTADRMRKAANLMVQRGLVVKYSSGWEGRGRPYSFNPSVGVIYHHTASANDSDNVLINGRSDLPGPLCHWALHKNGDVVLIASGYANHAGESESGAPTNATGWGIEATGPNDLNAYGPGAFDNYAEYEIMVACILEAEGWNTGKIWAHKESCYPSGRKVDPYFDTPPFEQAVTEIMQGDDMPLNEADKDFYRSLFNGVHEDFVTLLRGEQHASTQRILNKLDEILKALAPAK